MIVSVWAAMFANMAAGGRQPPRRRSPMAGSSDQSR